MDNYNPFKSEPITPEEINQALEFLRVIEFCDSIESEKMYTGVGIDNE